MQRTYHGAVTQPHQALLREKVLAPEWILYLPNGQGRAELKDPMSCDSVGSEILSALTTLLGRFGRHCHPMPRCSHAATVFIEDSNVQRKLGRWHSSSMTLMTAEMNR